LLVLEGRLLRWPGCSRRAGPLPKRRRPWGSAQRGRPYGLRGGRRFDLRRSLLRSPGDLESGDLAAWLLPRGFRIGCQPAPQQGHLACADAAGR